MKTISTDWISALWAALEMGHAAATNGDASDANSFPKDDPRHFAWQIGYWGHPSHYVFTEFGVNHAAEHREEDAFVKVVRLTGVHLRHHRS